jgi:hypothetical protein
VSAASSTEQGVLDVITGILKSSQRRAWCLPLPHFEVLAGGLRGFIKAPMLPFASLFEAETLLRMIGAADRHEYRPDPFSSESAFLNDSWPRDV